MVKILLLHGNRQTHEIYSGRIGGLIKKLKKHPELHATFSESTHPAVNGLIEYPINEGDSCGTLGWWEYPTFKGLETCLELLSSHWIEGGYDGIISFSQGAKLGHIIAAHPQRSTLFPNLSFVVLCAGFADPHPQLFPISKPDSITLASLHVYGKTDELVLPSSSERLAKTFVNPTIHVHEGGHHMPMKAADIAVYVDFIVNANKSILGTKKTAPSLPPSQPAKATPPPPTPQSAPPPPPASIKPDPTHLQDQLDECEALECIYPEEFKLVSATGEHPIKFSVDCFEYKGKTVALVLTIPSTYPDVIPAVSIQHTFNMVEFKVSQERALLSVASDTAKDFIGGPSAMSIVGAVKDWFEDGGIEKSLQNGSVIIQAVDEEAPEDLSMLDDEFNSRCLVGMVKSRIDEAMLLKAEAEGLEIAMAAWTKFKDHRDALISGNGDGNENEQVSVSVDNGDGFGDGEELDTAGKGGGRWNFVVGLIGKPSAGKSTFFNAATAFAKQPGQREGVEGAKMGEAPFTTIDANLGYCFVPAPDGSCPEDDVSEAFAIAARSIVFGAEHGRDDTGRRLIPVQLKDVAGLIPGAYQGLGKGNKFLDDLTDAACLVHIVDASGCSDVGGNRLLLSSSSDVVGGGGGSGDVKRDVLEDVGWVRRELVMWVHGNIVAKWYSVLRNGRQKLIALFTGYRQPNAMVEQMLHTLDKSGVGPSVDDIGNWSEADIRRLVSLFVGIRFPTALALNKKDVEGAEENIAAARASLPAHGAQCGLGVCSATEMEFVKRVCVVESATTKVEGVVSLEDTIAGRATCENNVWKILKQAISLYPPILVFPVLDLESLEPLPSLVEVSATNNSATALSKNHTSSLLARGGSKPSTGGCLQHVYIMKQSSTVLDLYNSLKSSGAIQGMFVRAEGMGKISDRSRQLKKDELLNHTNRIIRIQTNKNRAHRPGGNATLDSTEEVVKKEKKKTHRTKS